MVLKGTFGVQKVELLLQQVRDLGHCPKNSKTASREERNLAARIRRARKAQMFSSEQEAKYQALQKADTDFVSWFVSAGVDEAQRISQDLLMLESGTRTNALLRRLAAPEHPRRCRRGRLLLPSSRPLPWQRAPVVGLRQPARGPRVEGGGAHMCSPWMIRWLALVCVTAP